MKRTVILATLLLFALIPAAAEPAVAPQAKKPLAYLYKKVGTSPWILFKTQPLQRRLIALLGKTEFDAMVENMDPATELMRENGVLYSTGNRAHLGGEEEAMLMIDPEKDSIQVFMLHKATVVRGWAENNRLVAIPKDVQTVLNRWPKASLVQTLTSMRSAAATAAPD